MMNVYESIVKGLNESIDHEKEINKTEPAPCDSFYSKKNMLAIDESMEQLKQGKVVVKTMEELEAMADE